MSATNRLQALNKERQAAPSPEYRRTKALEDIADELVVLDGTLGAILKLLAQKLKWPAQLLHTEQTLVDPHSFLASIGDVAGMLKHGLHLLHLVEQIHRRLLIENQASYRVTPP